MRNSKMRRNDAGFTLIELVFAAGVMAIGLVFMMQSIISINHQSKVTDVSVAASHFSHSILESMQDKEFREVMQFNADGEEFPLSEEGTMVIDGVGVVSVHIYVVVDDGVSGPQRVAAIPVTDDEFNALNNIPNPVEIQVEIMMDVGMGDSNEFKFRTSTLMYTL